MAKEALKGVFDFPNLPYVKHGNFYVSETNAIATYLVDQAK